MSYNWESEYYAELDPQAELARQKRLQRLNINWAVFGVAVMALALAFFSLPADIPANTFQFWQFTTLYFSLEVGRAIALVINVRIERVSGSQHWRPILILGMSLGIAVIIGVAFGWHFHNMAQNDADVTHFWNYPGFWGAQACNMAVFMIEMALAFLMSQQSERYSNLVDKLAETKEKLSDKGSELAAIKEQLAAIKEQLAEFSLFLAPKYGQIDKAEKVLSMSLKHMQSLAKTAQVHALNLATVNDMVLSIRRPDSRQTTRVTICNCGSLNPLPSNAVKAMPCNNCSEIIRVNGQSE